MKFKRLVIACIGLSLAGAALAQTVKPEDLIKIRQGSLRVVGWHCTKVKNILDGQFNKEDLLASATVIQSVANAGLAGYFAPGTDKGVGFHESAARAEAVDPANAAKLADVSASFAKEANELVRVAAGGDKDAIKAQFGNLTKTCKSCHDDFRKKS